jgi:hypothetical protein
MFFTTIILFIIKKIKIKILMILNIFKENNKFFRISDYNVTQKDK